MALPTGRPDLSTTLTANVSTGAYFEVTLIVVTNGWISIFSSGPSYLPNTLVVMSMPREAGALNHAMSSTGAGSHAPRKYHWPSAHASTQA